MSQDTLKLNPALQRQLDRIEPSRFAPDALLYPRAARLKDGTIRSCVYFVEPATLKRLFLHDEPEAMPGLLWFSVDQVASIEESPARLPAVFANEIYRSGSRFGYHDFALTFSWWYRRDYAVGFVDFLEYPLFWGPADVKRVLLYRGKGKPRPVLQTYWCVFSPNAPATSE
jgi:hypothetical protein